LLWLACKTLLHEKLRFAIALTGIAVSAVLALIQVAIYLGSMGNATAVIRHTEGDIWITSKNIQTFDFAMPFLAERIDRVRSLPEVLWAEKILLFWGYFKLANGGREQVQVVGFNPDTGIGKPWNMLAGKPADLKGGNYMIADKGSEKRLGRLALGSRWELEIAAKRHAFKLVGLSEDVRSFTTAPVLFVSYDRLQGLLSAIGWGDQTSFIVAKLKEGADADRVARLLRDSLKDNEVMTRNEFIGRSIGYWTIQTGLGMAFFLTAVLAMVIGGAIVGQTIYASTLAHLREYGTLKAIGAKNGEIYQVVFGQAGVSAVGGYALAALVVGLVHGALEKAGVPLYLDASVFLGLFFVVLAACLASAYFSVGKIRTLDPVSVFKA
jgi:putative ABC transport system permease protein